MLLRLVDDIAFGRCYCVGCILTTRRYLLWCAPGREWSGDGALHGLDWSDACLVRGEGTEGDDYEKRG